MVTRRGSYPHACRPDERLTALFPGQLIRPNRSEQERQPLSG